MMDYYFEDDFDENLVIMEERAAYGPAHDEDLQSAIRDQKFSEFIHSDSCRQ